MLFYLCLANLSDYIKYLWTSECSQSTSIGSLQKKKFLAPTYNKQCSFRLVPLQKKTLPTTIWKFENARNKIMTEIFDISCSICFFPPFTQIQNSAALFFLIASFMPAKKIHFKILCKLLKNSKRRGKTLFCIFLIIAILYLQLFSEIQAKFRK